MGMKLGYDLTIEQTQKLVMTPELIQAIKILQFNTQELDSYVQEQILTNPVLEQEPRAEETSQPDASENEALSWQDYIRNSDNDDSSYRQWEEKRDDEEGNSFDRFAVSDITLREHLLFQLQFAAKDKTGRILGRYIIESLDDNGYLSMPVGEIAGATGFSEKQAEDALKMIQTLDPAGVGARNLQECLMIQLDAIGMLTEDCRRIVEDHLENLANNRLNVIAKDIGSTPQEVQEIGDLIRSLEPKPGRQFATGVETKYIIPDVIVEKTEDGFSVMMNNGSTPSLKISSYYRGLLQRADNDEQLSEYLSERVNSALWLIRSIDQRRQTIYNVAEAVVRFQNDFFERGPKYMKTLTLKDIAEEVGIHESTVSRSINGKYLQCDRGIFEIRHFFSAGVSDGRGEGISSSSIKEFIREIVNGEDPRKPLSDQAIADRLAGKGFEISRRTVAKYRDEMNILSSSKRKRY